MLFVSPRKGKIGEGKREGEGGGKGARKRKTPMRATKPGQVGIASLSGGKRKKKEKGRGGRGQNGIKDPEIALAQGPNTPLSEKKKERRKGSVDLKDGFRPKRPATALKPP